MTLRLSAQAEQDLAAQIEWLSHRAPQAARRAAAEIYHVFELLADNPLMGVQTSRGWREKGVRFGRDGFVICYIVRGSDILVLRFKHSRQNR